MDLFNYRFKTTSDLDGHTVGNLLLTAMTEITGNLSDGIEALSKVMNLKGKVVPLTEDNVVLMAEMKDGCIVRGEHNITVDKRAIERVFYKEEPVPTEEAVQAIKEADLIILSMGSLFTSVIPNLICDKIVEIIDESNAKIMYVCNMMTQPGETDDFTVTDHVKMLNGYLGKRKVDIVVANKGKIEPMLAKKYENAEQKDAVVYDSKNFSQISAKVIGDDFVSIQNDLVRHDVVKLGLSIFSYLLKM